MIYLDGAIVEGGFITATDSVPTIAGDGCTFIGVSFQNPTQFGTGCVFVNCTFIDVNNPYYNTQPHKTGEGNVFTDCTFNYVHFGENNVSNTIPIGFRPNVIGANMVMTPTTTETPKQTLKACPVCGKVSVVENGKVTVSENMINDKEEIVGGSDDVVSKGMKCCG